jgi:hypothetical protein
MRAMRAMRAAVIGVLVGVTVAGGSVWLGAQSRASTAAEQAMALAGTWTRGGTPPAVRGGPASGISPSRGGNPEQNARRREALRDITDPPNRLVVTVTSSMVILAAPDGRTTRLAPDGSKIKDENIGVERQTRWIDGRLVSQISGLGPKITQTFSVDAERRQLRVLVDIGASGVNRARRETFVYDADTR